MSSAYNPHIIRYNPSQVLCLQTLDWPLCEHAIPNKLDIKNVMRFSLAEPIRYAKVIQDFYIKTLHMLRSTYPTKSTWPYRTNVVREKHDWVVYKVVLPPRLDWMM